MLQTPQAPDVPARNKYHMRKWMNLFEQAQRLLYHGTSMGGFCGIAEANMLGANGGEDQASFSRNPDVSRKFTGSAIGLIKWGQLTQYHDFFAVDGKMEDGTNLSYRSEMAGGGGGVVLVCDWDKLAADHKIEPFDGDDDEEEEAVFNDIQNLDRYIVGIEIDKAGFAQYCALVEREGNDEDKDHLAAGKQWVARFG